MIINDNNRNSHIIIFILHSIWQHQKHQGALGLLLRQTLPNFTSHLVHRILPPAKRQPTDPQIVTDEVSPAGRLETWKNGDRELECVDEKLQVKGRVEMIHDEK